MVDRVLVTGGSGFVGAHCVLALLEAGYDVRTTIRSPQRAADVRSQLAAGADLLGADTADAGDRVEFAVADLLDDAGWADAVAGCRFVLHVASPFPMTEPKDPDELVRPAREGALRVLRAARDAGVERVVLTSSFAAIGYGHEPTSRPFTEVDWTELDSGRPISAYVRSKTLAEHAAWDFIAKEGAGLQLATVNPVGILGPVLGPDYSSSVELVKLVREGRLPRLPDVYFGVVDVRDVAGLHLLAMTRPEAAGERFLATAGDALSASELALLIRGHLGSPAGDRVRTGVMPTWVIRSVAPVSRRVRGSLPDIGVYRNGSSAKARSMLGWSPRSREEAVFATVDSLPPRLH